MKFHGIKFKYFVPEHIFNFYDFDSVVKSFWFCNTHSQLDRAHKKRLILLFMDWENECSAIFLGVNNCYVTQLDFCYVVND